LCNKAPDLCYYLYQYFQKRLGNYLILWFEKKEREKIEKEKKEIIKEDKCPNLEIFQQPKFSPNSSKFKRSMNFPSRSKSRIRCSPSSLYPFISIYHHYYYHYIYPLNPIFRTTHMHILI
jgi:hypothetical protein